MHQYSLRGKRKGKKKKESIIREKFVGTNRVSYTDTKYSGFPTQIPHHKLETCTNSARYKLDDNLKPAPY